MPTQNAPRSYSNRGGNNLQPETPTEPLYCSLVGSGPACSHRGFLASPKTGNGIEGKGRGMDQLFQDRVAGVGSGEWMEHSVQQNSGASRLEAQNPEPSNGTSDDGPLTPPTTLARDLTTLSIQPGLYWSFMTSYFFAGKAHCSQLTDAASFSGSRALNTSLRHHEIHRLDFRRHNSHYAGEATNDFCSKTKARGAANANPVTSNA